MPDFTTVSRIATAIWLIPEVIGIILQRPRRDASQSDRGSYAALVGGMALGIVLCVVLRGALPGLALPGGEAVGWAGVVLMLAGVVLRWVSIYVLGRFFTRNVTVAGGQTVVDWGPYRYVRHPSYSGSLLSLLGFGLAPGNWAGLAAIMLCAGAGFLYRVRIEERVLQEGLGQAYTDYMRRTKRFIPFVY
jgi:protein-S-isoprenylcysteine O-methyltransferase Ste14